MPKININIRMEQELKQEAEKLFAELGLNMTTAMTIFAAQSVRQGAIPFEITLNPPYNPQTMEILKEVKEGRNLSAEFDSVTDLMRDLDA